MKTLLSFPGRVIIFIVACLSALFSSAQQIHIHSISNARQPLGSAGYTLDGYYMLPSRGKLLLPDNFSSTGIYPKSIVITDGYTHRDDLAGISSIPDVDLFFFGSFNKFDMDPPNAFTYSEIDSFYNWSLRGGKLIIGSSALLTMYNPFILNNRWGYTIKTSVPSFVLPTEIGKRTKIFDGPFGKFSSAGQGGAAQGYFSDIPPTAVVLATTLNNEPTMLFDCATLDLIVSDIDMFTSVGGLSLSPAIENNQDRLWANSIAFMDAMETGPPLIIQQGRQLATEKKYASYEWYYGSMLLGTDPDFTPPVSGDYKVKVIYDYGCPSGFSKTIHFDKPLWNEGTELDVLITPNPAVENELGILYLLPDGNEYRTDIKIYDAVGKLVYNSKEEAVKYPDNKLSVDVSTWAAATYNVEVSVGGRSFVNRFVKLVR